VSDVAKMPSRNAHLLHGLAPVHVSSRAASMFLSTAWQLKPLTSPPPHPSLTLLSLARDVRVLGTGNLILSWLAVETAMYSSSRH